MSTENNASAMSSEITLTQSIAYALPMIVCGFLLYPVQLLLVGLYAKHAGLALATIGSVILFARIFDAITDPLIGNFSDRHYARTGTRKPWVVVGALGSVFSGYFLFTPAADASIVYFLGCYIAFYLAFTITEIPHAAWGGALASSSDQKNRIYSVRGASFFFGMLLYAALPLFPISEGEGFTPQVFKWSVLASAVMIIPVLIVSMKLTPNGHQVSNSEHDSYRQLLNDIIQNRLFLIIIGGFSLYAFAAGMYLSLLFIFADAYLGIGDELPLIFTLSLLLGVVVSGMVYVLPARWEKAHVYAIALMVSVLALFGMTLLTPGEYTLFYFMALTIVFSMCNNFLFTISPSMLSDIADYGTWKFRVERAGTYYSGYSLALKTCTSLGMGSALLIAGWSDFDATATSHTEENVFGLRLAFSYIPALLMFLSLPFILQNPINKRRHLIIQRQLERRMRRDKPDRKQLKCAGRKI